MLVIDPLDREARFPIAYGYQPVRGWAVKHYDIIGTQAAQRVKQNALAEGPWDACERLWTDAFEILPADFVFHPGTGDDVPDALFPNEPPHPWTAYMHAKAMEGLSDDQTEKLFGIYRTLRTPNYNAVGQQLNAAGAIVAPGDPRTEYFFKPNPANAVIDQLLRWGKRLPEIVNFPAWVDWRDYNDEFIDWDNSKYSPRNLSLTPTAGGTLTPGTTYIARVVTLRGADISGASRKSVESGANEIKLLGGQTAFQVNWLIKGDEEDPQAPPVDISSYRVYVGSIIAGVETWAGYFNVAAPATRTLLVTTLAGATAGVPPDVATAGLMVQIRRFECGLFAIPPYGLGTMMDRICQISCADWQWSGWGTNTYRNDKVRFMTPANRAAVFTLNQAETGVGSFKTYAVDRRSRPNEIVVNFRDRDDPYLGPAQPVVLPREQLQEDEGQKKIFTIDGGTMYRSQAQRCASFYARILCDMDQMAVMAASPKTYGFLPGDVFLVTNETPDWTDEEFIIRRKEENCEQGIGDQILLQVYEDDLYSDTDFAPFPSALPSRRTNPFAVPPPIDSLVLDEVGEQSVQGLRQVFVSGAIQAQSFHSPQVLRIWVYRPLGLAFEDTGIILRPDPVSLQAAFMYPSPEVGTYSFKVTVESELGVPAATDVIEDIIVLGLPPDVTNLTTLRVANDWFTTWDGSTLFLPEKYMVRIYSTGFGGALLREHTVQLPDWIPVEWTYYSGLGNQALVNRDPDGSIYMTTPLDIDVLEYLSQLFFGDVSFTFDVDDRPPFYQIGFWGTGIYIDNGTSFDLAKPDYIRPEQATFLARRLGPKTRLRIDIKNGQGEFYINDTLWTRSFQGVATPTLQLLIIIADPGTINFPQGALHCRVRPYQPRQFIYTEEMARGDNGGILPGTVRFGVTQVSGAGVESNPVSVTG